LLEGFHIQEIRLSEYVSKVVFGQRTTDEQKINLSSTH